MKSNQVGEVIALLKHQGFQLTAGASCVGDTNFHGSYSGFVCIEISMFRNQGQQTQFIDLHWHPSHNRGIFPPFDAVWNQRETFYINEQQIFTLPLNLSFLKILVVTLAATVGGRCVTWLMLYAWESGVRFLN